MFYLYAEEGLPAVEPTAEDIDKIKADIADLENAIGTNQGNAYWARARKSLLAKSMSDDIDEAKKEWGFVRMWREPNGSVCQLCGHHPIVYLFLIKNRINGNQMIVGSECIVNYLHIPGAPDLAVLKTRLGQLRSLLKKLLAAQATPEQIGAAIATREKLQAFERKLNMVIARIAAPDPDVDIRELLTALVAPNRIASALKVGTGGYKGVSEAVDALRQLQYFLTRLGEKSKIYKPFKLLPAVLAIMRKRSEDDDKYEMLVNLEKRLERCFPFETAAALVEMAWSEIRNCRKEAIAAATKEAEAAKESTRRNTQYEAEVLQEYDYLERALKAGVKANNDQIDDQLARYVKYIESDDFPRDLEKEIPHFVGYLTAGEDPIETAAFWIEQFANNLYTWNIESAIQRKFGIGRLDDSAGVKRALLMAANEGYIDVEHKGDPREEFIKKMNADDKEVIALLSKEVDDIKILGSRADRKNYEVMSEDLKIDVEKFYKCSPASVDFMRRFCTDIFRKWRAGQIRSLSFGQRNIVEKQYAITKGGRPVNASMWDDLKPELTEPYSPGYGR